jgi:SM-20-related protein
MEKDFEILIAGFIENKIGIDNHFLSDNLASHLYTHLLSLHKQKLFSAAGIGNATNLVKNKEVRTDCIYWLDRKNDNQYENEFLNLMEDFIKHLNISCYAGITNYEFHYSLYEKGSFYKKHLDQFQNNSDRKYSMISYLNANWMENDGGELFIHQNNNYQKISPTQGKTVFFKSNELLHEVLETNQPRMSIAGWLKDS